MPALAEYPLTDPDALSRAASEERGLRRIDIRTAWQYYDGDHRKPLKVKTGQADDNVILNVSRKSIDQAVSLLFGILPKIEIDESYDDDLTMLFDENDWPIFLHNIALSGGLAGHVFVKLVPEQPESQGRPDEGPSAAIGRVRFVLLDPELVTVFWRPDDVQKVVCYSIAWESDTDERRQDIVPVSGGWLVRDLLRRRGRSWEVENEVTWGFPWPPIVEWQNLPRPGSYYGEPDLLRPDLNDRINFAASNTLRIIKHHAHPKTIGTGMEAKDVQETSVDGLWTIPNESARVSNLEMQSDLGSSILFLQLMQGWFFSEHRAVDMTTFARDMGSITNFGLRTLYKDALDKLGTKRLLYGRGLVHLVERGLALLSIAVEPTISWEDPLPYNDQEEIQGVQTEMGLGILSKETAAEIRGRDWGQEKKRIAQEEVSSSSLGDQLLRNFEQGRGL